MNDAGGACASLWLLDGSQVQEDQLTGFAAKKLGASEKERFCRFARRQRGRQFLLGRMLLRYAVADLVGLSPNEVRVSERPGRSPQLTFPGQNYLVPHFSLSHSRHWIACVTSSQAPLGVDIEVNDPSRDIIGISELVFPPHEHSWLLSQPDTERLSAFYYLWSAREARYKLLCNLGRDTVCAPMAGDKSAPLVRSNCWHRRQLPEDNLTVVLCSDRRFLTIRQEKLSGSTLADWLTTDKKSQVVRQTRRQQDALQTNNLC
jgi:4'-phosphopantetheinyl transferase